MAWSFNVFTGNLDQTGSSGAVVFEGEEETFDDLPETVGDPAVGASFLVRSSTGVWLVNRRQAGIWIRRNNTGVRATDWEYGGDYPVNSVNGQTGNVSLTASDVGVNFAAPPAIGSTTRNTGAFTTLNANNGTLTASAPVLDLSQTWNNAAVTFTGLRFNVTNTASASASLIADLQVGGTSQFSVRRDGRVNCNSITVGGASTMDIGAGQLLIRNAVIGWDSNPVMIQNTDLQLFRDAADTLSQRRTSNPQTFRIYNTTDAGLTNYERGFISWVSNTLRIGTEKAGTGSARALEFQTDGTTVMGFTTGGSIRFGPQSSQSTTLVGWFGNCYMRPVNAAAGVLTLLNNALDGFDRLQFGGTTSSFPALKRSSTTLQVRLADDSAFAPLSCGALTLNGNLDASTRDIVTDTTTGTKIGTGTTQKIGFFNATPVVQQAAVADATDAASTQARLNDLLARLRTLGLIAT